LEKAESRRVRRKEEKMISRTQSKVRYLHQIFQALGGCNREGSSQ